MNLVNFFVFGLITFLITKISIPYLQVYFAAIPTNRGMHNIIKPTGGGIIFVLIYIIFSTFKDFYIPLISFPLALIGLLDDKFNMSTKAKFITQLITVIGTIIYIKNSEVTFLTNFLVHNFLFYFVFILLGISIINFVNFMDGIDGLVCGSFIIILSLINPLQNNLLPLIGALIGFLRLNWESSKIFMGDTGSLFLGSFIVSILYRSDNTINFIKTLLIMTPLIVDPIITIIRRILNGQNFLTAHRLHLYQRLVSNGLSHSKVSLIYIISIFLLGILYKFSSLMNLAIASFGIILIGIILDKKYATRFFQKSKN